MIFKDSVFPLADGAESGSYIYDVRLPSGNSIPMEVTIKKTGNSEDERESGSGEGDNSGNSTNGGNGEGSVSGNGIGGGSGEGSGSGGGSNDDGGSQEESRTETTAGNFPSAILEIVHRILGNRVQISGGSYIVSSIDGVYIAKSIIGIAVITPKKSVVEAVGLTAADINNGENISLYVCDSSDKEKKKALKNIADGMGKKVMAYVNVDMYSINKRGRVKTIRTASRPITMAFGVPAAFVNPAHSYSVICMDGNGKTVVFPDTDRDNKTITIETVVLLSQLRADDYIDVELDLDELDVTASEQAATYQEIKDYIMEKHGVKVHTAYIAQVKRKYGLDMRKNYRQSKNEKYVAKQCTEEKENYIREALEHFSMIRGNDV